MRVPSTVSEASAVPGAEEGSAPVDEDFLYHLYRGSELLVEGNVDAAKEALEQALRHQPEDAKGQDLLAGVYFRLGVYPRAIEIWERLIARYPRDPSLRVNVALARLKTGQPADAIGPLQAALQLAPDHDRAWGYLGLVYWRLGRFADARDAFLRAGQAGMARRMDEVLAAETAREAAREGMGGGTGQAPPGQTVEVSRATASSRAADAIEAAGLAVAELEVDPLASSGRASRPPSPLRRASKGQWGAVTDYRDAAADSGARAARTAGGASADSAVTTGGRTSTMRGFQMAGEAVEVATNADGGPVAPHTRALPTPLAAALSLFRREEAAVLPGQAILSLTATGGLVVDARTPVYVRRPALRWVAQPLGAPDAEGATVRDASAAPGITVLGATTVPRRSAGRETEELLGGRIAPFVALPVGARASVSVAAGEHIELLWLRDEAMYVREEALLAFEGSLRHDSGRIRVDARRALDLVHLVGRGVLALRLTGRPAAIRLQEGQCVLVRADLVLGWHGRLFPVEPPPGVIEPALAFRGEGDLLLG